MDNDKISIPPPPISEDTKSGHQSDESEETMQPNSSTRCADSTSNISTEDSNNHNFDTQEPDRSKAFHPNLEHIPSLTKSRQLSDSSDGCILIPEHAVADDIHLKFLLHPSLSSSAITSRSSLHNPCANEHATVAAKLSNLGHSKQNVETKDSLELGKGFVRKGYTTTQAQCTPTTSRVTKNMTPNSASSEQFVIKTAKEILYDIAKGKWNRKGVIIDEESEGTKKFGSKPCSNANCVRAAEKERRQKDKLLFHDFSEAQVVFEDGNLPSYHSLLNLWKSQNDQKPRHAWLNSIFKNGFPENEMDFIHAWRKCRKDPKAFGIKISEPRELPLRTEEPKVGSRVLQVMKPYNKHILVAKYFEKQKPRAPPVRLAGRELYNPDWKPLKSFREREKLKCQYEAYRRLYPHLPVLRDVDFRVNPTTVSLRLKQAEEWHRLITASTKPTAEVPVSHYAADIQYNYEADESRPETAESSELDFAREDGFVPTATAKQNNTTNSLHKKQQRSF